MNTRK